MSNDGIIALALVVIAVLTLVIIEVRGPSGIAAPNSTTPFDVPMLSSHDLAAIAGAGVNNQPVRGEYEARPWMPPWWKVAE